MANLSDKKRSRIARLIVDHHLAFTADVLGDGALTHDERQRLVADGILQPGTVEHAQVSLQAAHTVGKLGANVSNAKMAKMSPEQFWGFVETIPPQFNDHDLAAIVAARNFVGRAIKNLGTGILNEFEHAADEERTKARHDALRIVQHEVALGVARNSSGQTIMRRLKQKIGESERNWALVVVTELHNTKEHGKALTLAVGGNDPVVYVLPRPDACRYCKKLYLKGDRPRLFKLSTLINNGTNVGRKAGRPNRTEWKPVVGATHPACQCELHEMPKGFSFDENGILVQSTRKALADDLPPALEALISHRCEV